MAASDQVYRSQKALDICFAVTSTLMLLSIVAMFLQDYYRSWKPEQRDFRPVESAINLREAFADIPSKEKFDEAREQVAKAKEVREENSSKIRELNREVAELTPEKLRKEQTAAGFKSLVESRTSFFNMAVDKYGVFSDDAAKWKKEMEQYQADFARAQAEVDDVTFRYREKARERDGLEKGVTQALSRLKSLNDDLIRRVRTAEKKQWGWADNVRSAWFMDAFQSPLKIHQYTINDLPIDYNFKYVTRFDRCQTCHQGIDRPGFGPTKVRNVQHLGDAEERWDGSIQRIKSILARAKDDDEGEITDNVGNFRKFVDESGIRDGKIKATSFNYSQQMNTEFHEALENLRDIIQPDPGQPADDRVLAELEAEIKLVETQTLLRELRTEFKGTPEEANLPDPNKLKITRLGKNVLTTARVKEFSSHPRLDIFVGANSKHPAEKFGCTICHGGQPSGTDFTFSSHTPNSSHQAEHWAKDHEWKSMHDWEFPMLPKRFQEASCLQCHHQVTDLITSDNRNQAPTVVQGYNLIREVGCFGCHEIQGQKNGRQVGPDMRLEPTPPLESLSPAEREKAKNDPDNPPGTLRKVGPSLMRLSEKIANKDFVARWIKAPREFRPDTRMPHYYGLSNNDPTALKGTGQEEFPDTEIASITHFLYTESTAFLGAVAKARQATPEIAAAEEKELRRLTDILGNKLELMQRPAAEREQMKKEQARLKTLVDLRAVAAPLAAAAPEAKATAGDPFQGRKLFSERGCLACHQHEATTTHFTADGKTPKVGDKDFLPPISSDAHFGPNLSQVVEKLLGGRAANKAAAQLWLVQWLKNPSVHSPRTKMPVTHLTDEEAAHLAAWLLEQKATQLGDGWENIKVETPDRGKLKKLAKVYLSRILTSAELDGFLEKDKGLPTDKELPVDEKELAERLKNARGDAEGDNAFKWYLGKKGISRLGCFGCHNIPGFDSAKSIGVGLNDWGKKDSHRLAFEDIEQFIKDKYVVVPSLTDEHGKPVQKDAHGNPIDWAKKPAYEEFFAHALHNEASHPATREGYLNQKIRQPRSYDYLRERAWDDRSRMPQFKFSQVRQEAGESSADFKARADVAEAKARESVMTFVLGLIAEPIAHQYVNTPKPERLAEVKGKQVLDRFNCAGCHQIRPGFFDIKVTAAALAQLDYWDELSANSEGRKGDYNFFNHSAWYGPLAQGAGGKMPDQLQLQGSRPQIARVSASLAEKKKPGGGMKVDVIRLTLTTDLRWLGPDSNGKLQPKTIRAGDNVGLLPRDVTYPPVNVLSSPEEFAHWQKTQDTGGGVFADLLTKYLTDFTPPKEDEKIDDSRARASVPPILLREGERVQPSWLKNWLRDPTPVRKITVLRMPKFNMSEDEADALVAYFNGVDRIQNPGIGLTYPYDAVPQRAKFTEPYWQQKNSEYVARLKKTPDPDDAKRTLYERRLAELKPHWEKLRGEMTKELNTQLDAAKDDATKKAVQAKLAHLKEGGLEKDWETEQAYYSDSFRMAGKICTQCHSFGGTKLDPNQVQGPPLDLAWERLRPDWAKRWISHPQRFLTYGSSMPVNFPSYDKTKWEQYFAGEPLDRVSAIRDLLMIYPRVADLPINRYWLQVEIQAAKAAAEKK